MSTRCYIGKLIDGNKVKFVYCHHDGFLNGVGKILFENYNDEKKIDDLLDNGNMSSLGKLIKDCDFYNEEGFIADSLKDLDLYKNRDIAYIYVYGGTQWFVCDFSSHKMVYKPLKNYFKGKKNE